MKTEQEKNYSIIIPHKNIPDLLQRCLDSIPRRQDIQIIIIDDNSDPDKVDFGRFPGLGDPIVEVLFTKEGQGAGYARNTGLTKAIGKWLLFADADDFFIDGFLRYLDKYKDSNYDLVYFGIQEISRKPGQEAGSKKYRYNRLNKIMREAVYGQKYDQYKYTAFVPWGKLIKHSLVKENNLTFDETMVANDKMFSIKTAYAAKNIFFDESKIYTYETCRSSLSAVKTVEANYVRFCVCVRVNLFLESIAQKKYKINLIHSLIDLYSIKNVDYFRKGLEIIKENKINMFIETFNFLLLLPYRVYNKIKNKIRDRTGFARLTDTI